MYLVNGRQILPLYASGNKLKLSLMYRKVLMNLAVPFDQVIALETLH